MSVPLRLTGLKRVWLVEYRPENIQFVGNKKVIQGKIEGARDGICPCGNDLELVCVASNMKRRIFQSERVPRKLPKSFV